MALRLVVLVGTVVVGLATHAPAADGQVTIQLAEDLQVVELEEGVYQVVHAFPWRGNSLLVQMPDSAIVWVDTPYEDEATLRVLEWIHRTFGSVPIVEINTGYHWDNAGGNGLLLSRGIPVYGADLSARLLRERGEWIRSETLATLTSPEHAKHRAVHAGQRFQGPDHVFPIEETQRLRFGSEVVEVFYPGPSHAPDNLVVYFRERGILFGGCMVRALGAAGVGYTGDADLIEWPKAVQRTVGRYPAARWVVPGHGAAGGPEALSHTIRLLQGPG
jgi:glyoxylase-like metal-dependent hydrolase (beta-lactamase superfamily II)